MSSCGAADPVAAEPLQRMDALFEELAELTGQRNAIDGRVVEIVAELDRDQLWGVTGARSVSALVAWRTGVSPANARTVAAIAARLEEFPRCAAGMWQGQLSLDQVGVIAQRAGKGSDEHYAELAAVATVSQLRTAVKLEPRPQPEPGPDPGPPPRREITKTADEESTTWRITLPHAEAATFDTALQAHLDALITGLKHDHTDTDTTPPMPSTVDAFVSLVEAGWDTEVARRPHQQHTTVVVHLDVDKHSAAIYLGPLLTDGERQYLTCDATYEAWFHRDGQAIGSGRTTRQISRRLRRALEHRDRCCVVPGCGATRGLHAHHLQHWEDGGSTELTNLAMVCTYHHRLHHRGEITITGPAHDLTVTDSTGRPLPAGSLARSPTTPPPTVAPCTGPTGERADWWWYQPSSHNRPHRRRISQLGRCTPGDQGAAVEQPPDAGFGKHGADVAAQL